jgi:hypothetical protein
VNQQGSPEKVLELEENLIAVFEDVKRHQASIQETRKDLQDNSARQE